MRGECTFGAGTGGSSRPDTGTSASTSGHRPGLCQSAPPSSVTADGAVFLTAGIGEATLGTGQTTASMGLAANVCTRPRPSAPCCALACADVAGWREASTGHACGPSAPCQCDMLVLTAVVSVAQELGALFQGQPEGGDADRCVLQGSGSSAGGPWALPFKFKW